MSECRCGQPAFPGKGGRCACYYEGAEMLKAAMRVMKFQEAVLDNENVTDDLENAKRAFEEEKAKWAK